jgi:prophage regulatory protein
VDAQLNGHIIEPRSSFLRIDEVCARVGLSKSSLYRSMNHRQNPFPRPIKLGRASRWSERQIREWTLKCEAP